MSLTEGSIKTLVPFALIAIVLIAGGTATAMAAERKVVGEYFTIPN
jgi:hypothetical protein